MLAMLPNNIDRFPVVDQLQMNWQRIEVVMDTIRTDEAVPSPHYEKHGC